MSSPAKKAPSKVNKAVAKNLPAKKASKANSSAGSTGRSRPVSVSFWRIVNQLDGKPIRAIDWQSTLGGLAQGVTKDFQEISGAVAVHEQVDRLVLSRDRGIAPRQRQRKTGNKTHMALSGADWDPIEECFITFLDKNVFACTRTSNSAPPPSLLAAWLAVNQVPSAKAALRVDPLLDPDRLERVKTSMKDPAALWVDVVAEPPAQLPTDGGLFQGLFSLKDIGSDVTIRIKVSTKKGQSSKATRKALWEEAQKVRTDIAAAGGVVTRASVKVPGESQPIDLVRDQIVLKQNTKLPVSSTNRSIAEQAIFHLHDAMIASEQARIQRCLKAL